VLDRPHARAHSGDDPRRAVTVGGDHPLGTRRLLDDGDELVVGELGVFGVVQLAEFHTTLRHILPGVVGPLTVAGTLLAATAILLESALSFLGFGISAPTATWGGILNETQSLTIIETMPWLWIPAGALITMTVLSINFVGDGLRDALDPRLNDLRE
jgi:peptide/nickel transport system permease protein